MSSKFKKGYFPKDEKYNLFSIILSKDGLVIPLCNFNKDKKLHLTFYIKQIREETLFNIHLTDEINKKKLFNEEIFIPTKEIENYFKQKEIEIQEVMIDYFNEMKDKSKYELISNFFCIDCYMRERMEGHSIESKTKANHFYSLILSHNSLEIKALKKYPLCNIERHNLVYNIQTDKLYVKFIEILIEYEKFEKFANRLTKLFEPEFKKIEIKIDKIKKMIMENLKDD